MIEVLLFIVGAIVGFAIGVLVYRNNAVEAEAKLDELKKDIETAKEAVKEIKE